MGTTTQKKKILVAVAEDSVEKITALLGDDYQLSFATSLLHAQTLLNQFDFDLIVCGVRFDGSRLLDLLQYCKATPGPASIPFLCMRIKRGKLSVDSFQDLVLASSALGAAGFIDIEEWDRIHGAGATTVEYRKTVRSLLGLD